LKGEHNYIGHSDCEVIPHFYEESDIETVSNVLHGKFGVIIYDQAQERFFVTRDHLGIIPVYIGRGSHGEFFVASELKAFHDFATSIEILLPGKI
jgi:asparagine synthase (glutamine-hydrolysing)